MDDTTTFQIDNSSVTDSAEVGNGTGSSILNTTTILDSNTSSEGSVSTATLDLSEVESTMGSKYW